MGTNTEMKLSATLLALASGQTTVSTDTATAGTAGTADNGAVILGCTLDDSILDCSPSGMSLDVPVCALEALGFASDAEVTAAFALGNEWTQECQYSGITDMGGYHFVADHSQCDISTASNETHIFYQGALRGTGGFNNGIISRERVFELNLQCDFSRESTVSIDSFFTPIASSVTVELDTIDSQFSLAMSLYTDENYVVPMDEAHTVEVPDPIYARLDLLANEDLVVQLKTCWATPSEDPHDDLSYVFISQSGGHDTTSVGIVRNCASTSAEFWVESFRFVNDEDDTDSQIYLHCDVHICDANLEDCSVDALGNSCLADDNDEYIEGSGGLSTDMPSAPINFGARKRRDVPSKASASLAVGPIKIRTMN